MSDNAAPSGADVSGASSSAPKTAPAVGRPSRVTITRALEAKKTVSPPTAPASPVEDKQEPGVLGAEATEKKPEGDTPDLEGGRVENKTNEKKEPETVPIGAFKERLREEKGKREKVEADLHAAKGEAAKIRAVLDAALKENERLTEQLASGAQFDEKGEELHALRLQREVETRIAQLEDESKNALLNFQRDSQVSVLAEQIRSEVAAACEAFPLVSPAEVRAALRENPGADVRQLAQAKHEERAAYVAKQNAAQAAKTAPVTVAKPTGAARFNAPLSAKGMAQAFEAARAKR